MRQSFIRCAIALTCAGAALSAHAQASDNRITFIVAAAPGGALDKIARITGRKMSENLGVPVVVDNKGGANGIIAGDYVSKARPDGRTVLFDQSSMLLHPFIREKVPFNPAEMTPLMKIVNLRHVLVVNAAIPIKDTREFVAFAKANPKQLNFSTPGHGSAQQLVVEQVARAAGIQLTHVPYKGGAPAMLAVVSGEVQLSAVSLTTTLPFIESGKVRPLAVDSPERVESLPNVPTFSEVGFKGIPRVWFGAFLPPATPASIVKQLNEAMASALKDPTVQEAIRKDGFQLIANTPEQFAAEIVTETRVGEKLVKDLNIRIE